MTAAEHMIQYPIKMPATSLTASLRSTASIAMLVRLRLTMAMMLLAISCTFGQGTNAQEPLILSYEQNSTWLNQLQTMSTKEKLSAVSERLLSDTAVYVPQAFPDRIRSEDQYKNEKRIKGICRPLLILGTHPANIGNQTSVSTIKQLANLLTIKNIKELRILRDQNATAIYGSNASCGVLILDVKKNKIQRKVEKMKF